MRRIASFALIALLGVLVGCGGPSTGVQHAGNGQPPEVTDESFHELETRYWRMDAEDPARVVWRDALLAHLSRGSARILARGDYDEVIQHLARLTSLMTPEDVEEGRVPPLLAPLAHWVIEHGAPRGDEGRVMGAHVLLAAIGEDAATHRAERDSISRWGRDARVGIENPIERYGDLIQVWEQHEQIAPTNDALDTLARLYVEQRDALLMAFGPEGQGSRAPARLSYQELRLAPLLVQRAPLDVAAVYLRHGDLPRAIERVQRMGDRGVEERLVAILQRAREDNAQGAEALGELAQGFVRARPSIAQAICRVGARRFQEDPRFPLCLARVAIELEEPGAATSWYAEAVRLAPAEREVYDEALAQLEQIMEGGQLESDVAQSRSIARDALAILDERVRRWPEPEPTVRRDGILLSMGRAALGAGNVEEARRSFEASLEARPSREAEAQLGTLLERTGEPAEAARHYRAALDLTTETGPEGQGQRAELLEHLGDAFRQAGDDSQARRMYRQALGLWGDLLEHVRGPRRAIIDVRRGVLYSRLGEAQSAREAFTGAMEAAPSWREPYAVILAHLVVSEPDLELAQDVLRRAQYQLTLEPEWKVYFALWVQTIAGRASAAPDADVQALLHDMSDGEGWSAHLAAFGERELPYEGLVGSATSVGERTKASFYQGARLLGAGDVQGARERFEQVLESGMVTFFEYSMAQELLAGLRTSTGPSHVAEQ
jgi:tetratricopeptide (TPR) repeat protein